MEPLVRSVDGAAVARADVAAVQDVLDGDVDVDALAASCNLNSVAERRDGAVCPAAAAVLRDVLVTGHGAVVDTILVAPVERVRDILGLDVLVRERPVAVGRSGAGRGGRVGKRMCATKTRVRDVVLEQQA